MSIRLMLFVMIILFVVMIDGYRILGALTENECKAYSTSDDINERVQALFACPRKWRPKLRRIQSAVAKRSIEEDEFDDFYLFW